MFQKAHTKKNHNNINNKIIYYYILLIIKLYIIKKKNYQGCIYTCFFCFFILVFLFAFFLLVDFDYICRILVLSISLALTNVTIPFKSKYFITSMTPFVSSL